MPNRKGGMRSQSRKRAKLMREVRKSRDDFAAEYEVCCCCRQRKEITVHEIARGSFRELALRERSAWLPACKQCNEGPLHDHTEWPISHQLALKALVDPDYYDRVGLNKMRSRKQTAVTEIDVLRALKFILEETAIARTLGLSP